MNYVDVSTLSFHATKLFHTIEGGAVIATDDKIAEIMEYQRRFGHDGPYNFTGVGINAKLSEVHAAMGLCVLDDIEAILKARKEQWEYYHKALANLEVDLLHIEEKVKYNYAYFPIVFRSESQVLEVLKRLEAEGIMPRRYFYPSLNTLNYVEYQEMPVSESVSCRAMCLPLFHDLEKETQDTIVKVITEVA
jgi:dTDP-4-amino-4,6-dideoxygalactose transaminase